MPSSSSSPSPPPPSRKRLRPPSSPILAFPPSPSSSSSSSSSSCCTSGRSSPHPRLSPPPPNSPFYLLDFDFHHVPSSSEREDSSAESSCSSSALSSAPRKTSERSPDVSFPPLPAHRSPGQAVEFLQENRDAEGHLHGNDKDTVNRPMGMAFDPDTVFRFLDGTDSKADYDAFSSCCSLDNASWFLHDFDGELGGDFVNEWMAEVAANLDHLDDTLDSASCVFHL